MNASIIPKTYEEWTHCITVECGLELTQHFISQRISALKDDRDYYTQQLVKLYGQEHRQQVLGWFSQAQESA